MEYQDFCFVNADKVNLDKLIFDLIKLRDEAEVAGFKELITTIETQPNKPQNYLYIKGKK